MGTDSTILGIDIGGTKTAAGAVAGDGCALSYVREATPQGVGAGELLGFGGGGGAKWAWEASGATPVAVGVGCGGPMRYPSGIVSPLHIPAWREFPRCARGWKLRWGCRRSGQRCCAGAGGGGVRRGARGAGDGGDGGLHRCGRRGGG
ncbi:MAG: hypothetical protein U0841_27585 [Chloroflexia bacterium]